MRIYFPILFRTILLFTVLAVLVSCQEKKPTETAPPAIPVVQVKTENVPIYKEFVGQVYGIYDIPIRTRVEGWLEGIHFTEGGWVKKGQMLYNIDPDPFLARVAAAKSELASAKTYLANAKSELDRIEPLASINAVSQSDLDAARATYEANLASVEAAEANLRYAEINLGYTKLYSPINGMIGKTKAKVGEFVGREPNPVILNTVSKIDTVRVEFFLTESDYLFFSRKSLANPEEVEHVREDMQDREGKLQLILSDGTVHKYPGKIDFVDREVNPGTGSLLIQASFPNPENILRPGQFARVKGRLRDIPGALIIPQRCLRELQGKYSVYVVGEDGKVESRSVEVGPTYRDYQLIINGLEENEMVVLEGLQMVREGMTVKPVLKEYESKFQEL